MKFLKNVMAGLLTVSFGLSLSTVSFADKGHGEAFVKLLNNASAALQSSHPDLAAELTKFSNEEANEKEEKGEKKELEGKEEKAMEERHEAHLKLLRDSAAALQTSHPDLAADLTKTAERKAKRMAEKKEGKEDTEEMEEKEGK